MTLRRRQLPGTANVNDTVKELSAVIEGSASAAPTREIRSSSLKLPGTEVTMLVARKKHKKAARKSTSTAKTTKASSSRSGRGAAAPVVATTLPLDQTQSTLTTLETESLDSYTAFFDDNRLPGGLIQPVNEATDLKPQQPVLSTVPVSGKLFDMNACLFCDKIGTERA